MILGEYGVLYGKHALVCAIDKRMIVTLTPREDNQITLDTSLGQYATTIETLNIEKPFQFLLSSLKHMQARLTVGCDIKVESQFSDKVGFGSSAAVTVATLATLYTWHNIKTTPLDLVRHARNVVRAAQEGVGSGADVAASVYGGLVGYQAQPLTAEKFSQTHPLIAIYAGYKTKTQDAIKLVQQRFQTQAALFRHLTNSIGQCALDGMQAVRKGDWQRLGEIMNIQQGLMESLGVSNADLRGLIDVIRSSNEVLGAKISGAGLGDCVIGLGEAANISPQQIPLMMTLQGVTCEKI